MGVATDVYIKTYHRSKRRNSIDKDSRFARVNFVRDYLATRAAEILRDVMVTENIYEPKGAHYASYGLTLLSNDTGFDNSITKESSVRSDEELAEEATTVINLIAEGDVMVSHTLKSPKLSGAKAIRSVHGTFAGGDSEHVDEHISVKVSEGRNETQPSDPNHR